MTLRFGVSTARSIGMLFPDWIEMSTWDNRSTHEKGVDGDEPGACRFDVSCYPALQPVGVASDPKVVG
jgi:hypothetical protein